MAGFDGSSQEFLISARDRGGIISPERKRCIAQIIILMAVALERLAHYGVAGSLAFYLSSEPLCWQSITATQAVLVHTGCMYVTGLFSGWLSDTALGRYYTIVLGYVLYILSFSYLTAIGYYTQGDSSIMPTPHYFNEGDTPCNISYTNSSQVPICTKSSRSLCEMELFFIIIVSGVGSGIVRTNLVPFGGEQVRVEGQQPVRRFFNYLYWCVNAGSLVAFTVVAFVEQNFSFFIGFTMCTGSIVLSFLVFSAGTLIYQRRGAPDLRIVPYIFNMYKAAWASKRLYKLNRSNSMPHRPGCFLDYAKMCYGGREHTTAQVDDVKSLGRTTTCFLLLLPYWICYSQVNSTGYLSQGLHLRLDNLDAEANSTCPHNNSGNVDYHTLTIPAASLTTLNVLFVIFLIPLMQRLYPVFARRRLLVTSLQRMLLGMLLAVLCLLAGAVLEYFRLANIKECGTHKQVIEGTVYDAAPGLSIWWQVPQYSLLGASEVFLIVTGIEYAYMEAPRLFQGTIMGLFWFMAGVGSFIGIAFTAVLQNVLEHYIEPSKNIAYFNNDHMDYYFWSLASFLVLGLFVLAFVGKRCDLHLNKSIQSPSDDFADTERLINDHQ